MRLAAAGLIASVIMCSWSAAGAAETWLLPDGRVLVEGREFVYQNEKYSRASSRNEALLKRLGAKPLVRQPDAGKKSEWYEIVDTHRSQQGDAVVETYTYGPRYTLNEFKDRLKTRAIEQMRERLLRTDWYVLRFVETGAAVPQAVQLEREFIRTKAAGYVQQIDDALTYRDLADLTMDWK